MKLPAMGATGELSALVGQSVRSDQVSFLIDFLARGHGEKELPLRIPQLFLDNAFKSCRTFPVTFSFDRVARELGNLLKGLRVGPHV